MHSGLRPRRLAAQILLPLAVSLLAACNDSDEAPRPAASAEAPLTQPDPVAAPPAAPSPATPAPTPSPTPGGGSGEMPSPPTTPAPPVATAPRSACERAYAALVAQPMPEVTASVPVEQVFAAPSGAC